MSQSSHRSSNPGKQARASKTKEANSGFTADCSAFTRSRLPKFGNDASVSGKSYHKPRIYIEALERHVHQREDRLRTLGVQPPEMQRVGSSQGLHGYAAASMISDMVDQIETLQVEIEELEEENRSLSLQQPTAFSSATTGLYDPSATSRNIY
ncbi:hypothetical protein AURDEDRAFT_155844 [Auricularia subglabra TFB-10046 SS5]|nr:hypothetical protein AURDEDRAFT_155844 [Auricularia subglabra TFB-10046 SS5]